jgi:type I restriction-modification system DNA methylase subunit
LADPAETSDLELVTTLVGILDSYRGLYVELSGGLASNYLDYVRLRRRDEEMLVQPTLFPEFLEHILGFSKLDYIPELSSVDRKKPDFTPSDTSLHPFIFETKGSDSTREDLIDEYAKKSKGYIQGHQQARYAVITNMSEFVVFAKNGDRLLSDFSFSVVAVYALYKDRDVFTLKDANVKAFIRFAREFRRKPLSPEAKIEAIANAKPYPPLDVKIRPGYREMENLTGSIRRVIEWLRQDVCDKKGPKEMLRLIKHLPERRRLVALEIYGIRSEISLFRQLPEEVDQDELERIVDSKENFLKKALDLYFYRVAYFTMARILLIRAWEDSQFIEQTYQALFDGGFAKWYFQTFNRRLGDVLRQAFVFAKEKYEWLFTDETNYAWYTPSDETLVDVLYEFARYNLSVLNRDVLGVVYEDYLDRQDKKNKGQYYTPPSLVSLIWDRLGYLNDKDFYKTEGGRRVPRRVFDPATGSGGFLVEAAKRIRSDIYPTMPISRLEAMKEAIIAGLFGSEISPFSYYITEVNLLLQLTPVIKRIVELDKKRRETEGKFTLAVIRQDSLGLHKVASTVTQEPPPKVQVDSFYASEILKPTGEKFRVHESIRNNDDFDFVVANPPYIGEDGHKELFRRTLQLYPFWNKYYQGKMDYLYFFIILGLQKLRAGGKLGFITTSYWLTADGASKLRRFILENARIREITHFGEMRLFENAPGQHNIIFVLEREPDADKRNRNMIKVVEVKKQFEASTTSDRVAMISDHVRTHAKEEDYSDEHVEVYISPVVQGELTEKAWYLFHREDVDELLTRIREAGRPLISFCDVNQGLVPGCLSVDSKVLDSLPPKTISEYGIKKGMGVFVLTLDEAEGLRLPDSEKGLLRPYYKNSDVGRYTVMRDSRAYVIYTSKQTQIKKFPTILRHLEIFRPRLELKRETQEGRLPWWSLHWPREAHIFEGEKIVCPYRSKVNTFAYSKSPLYGSTDMYFVTPKSAEQLDGPRLDMRYILGVLNSNVIRVWTHFKTKPKGDVRELFFTPLKEFPIRAIDFGNEADTLRYKDLIILVDEMLELRNRLAGYDKFLSLTPDESIAEVAVPPISELEIVNLLTGSQVRTVESSDSLSFGEVDGTFQLKSVGKLQSTALEESQFDFQIVLKGFGGERVRIEGEREILRFLRAALRSKNGASWDEISRTVVPDSYEVLQNRCREVQAEIAEIWERVPELQTRIDGLVCQLYGLEKRVVDRAVEQSTSESD